MLKLRFLCLVGPARTELAWKERVRRILRNKQAWRSLFIDVESAQSDGEGGDVALSDQSQSQ